MTALSVIFELTHYRRPEPLAATVSGPDLRRVHRTARFLRLVCRRIMQRSGGAEIGFEAGLRGSHAAPLCCPHSQQTYTMLNELGDAFKLRSSDRKAGTGGCFSPNGRPPPIYNNARADGLT